MNFGNDGTNRLYLGNDFKHKYFLRDEDINLADKNSSQSIILNLIADNSVVLDVGCSYGYLGKWLKINKNCIVYGIDNNADALNYARQNCYYKDLFLIDLDNPNNKDLERFNQFGEIFDYVILADVLEHLKDPTNSLSLLSKKLKPYSSFIVSVPNIANIDIIFNLIEGRFNYGENGILDNSHLRFFTRGSFAEWIESINESHILDKFRLNVNFIANTIYLSNFVKSIIAEKSILYSLLKFSNPEVDVLQNIFALTKVKRGDRVVTTEAINDIKPLNKIYNTLNDIVNISLSYEKKLIDNEISLRKKEAKIFALQTIIKKIYQSNNNIEVNLDQNEMYQLWIKYNEPNQYEIDLQKGFKFNYMPKISIIVPAYNTPYRFLQEMVESVINQSYKNWELCIAYAKKEDNANENDDINSQNIYSILKYYINKDNRIKVKFLDKNYGAGGNSNEALSLMSGEYALFLDSDDLLPPFCLYEFVKSINENLDADFIYSDEDKVSEDSTVRKGPHFKPDFAPDTLRSYNYICHTYCLKTEIIKTLKGFREKGYESQDYDMVLRASEIALKIIHIPKILYHWREYSFSSNTNAGLSNKLFLIEGAKRSISDHLKRVGLEGYVENTPSYSYKIKYKILGEPLVSIIIPNTDQYDYLSKCLNSIIKKTNYKNFEIIIVENNSKDKEIFGYYQNIQEEFKFISVVKYEKNFNFSMVCNFGASFAKGDILLFLNNDTEVISNDWMEEMIQYVQRKDVGVVGAKLFHFDGTIQHAGVVLGIGGFAGHMFEGFPINSDGYINRLNIVQNLSAVTGACFMTKKEVFNKLGGFEESDIPSDDIDFCVRARLKKYLVVFTPYAMLYHKELGTRIYNIDKDNIAKKYFREKWGFILEKGDPYYNPNLTKLRVDFSINLDELLTIT